MRFEPADAPNSDSGDSDDLVWSDRVRGLVETLVCLAIAVILFRTFEVEGYMISTGSMAPCLLGFHKRVTCPRCDHQFAMGITEEEAQESPSSPVDKPAWQGALVECPNCGQRRLSADRITANQGDQLLVHKHAYILRPPRRWEVVVFRNPHKASQAYVKRIVGLPGERLQIIDGDVFVDDQLQRKTLREQRSIRIPVYDAAHRPHNDENWQDRWLPESTGAGWTRTGKGFEFQDVGETEPSSDAGYSWVTYRHFLREGGRHETSVRLSDARPLLPLNIPGVNAESPEAAAQSREIPLYYDGNTRRLVCRGVMPELWLERLISQSQESAFVAAIQQLYRESHFAPISDKYGYNRSAGGREAFVRDLMLSAELHLNSGLGEFVVQMTDGVGVYSCLIDAGRRVVEMQVAGEEGSVRTAPLMPDDAAGPLLLEMSLFDRQVMVAIDGRPAFAPWELEPRLDREAAPSRTPVRIGARGVELRVESLKLFRDVYYTGGTNRNGIERPYQLSPQEYFVLGDNSPVSLDSRSWPHGGVSEHLLVGKPFLVHLPSRPGEVKIGDWVAYIRIPDLSRIRYIY